MMKKLIEVDREVPLVYFRWLLPLGAGSDQRKDEGLANFALEMFRRGNSERTREQLAAYLAEVSSQLAVQLTSESAQISAVVPSKQIEDFCGRLMESLMDTGIRADEIEKFRRELTESLEVSLESPETRAGVLWRRLLYSDDSWGNLVTGSKRSLGCVEREALVGKRKSLFQFPSLLAVNGDVSEVTIENLEKSLDAHFPGDTSLNLENQPFKSTGFKCLGLWHDPRQEQSSVVIGWTASTWTSEEWIRLRMVEKILCREYSSLLCQDFRQRAGLTYGVYGAHQLSKRGSVFRLRYSTSSQFGPQFLRDILSALKAFSKGEGTYSLKDQDGRSLESIVDLGDESLDICRRKTLNSLPFQYHTSQARLMRRLEETLYGVKVSDPESYREVVSKTTSGDLKSLSQKMFSTPSITVSVVDNMDKNKEAYKDICDWDQVEEDGEGFCGL